jgi:hypothetical protein
LASIFDTVVEHHPRWSELMILGAEPRAGLLAAIRDTGVVRLERVPGGVVIRRAALGG